MNKIQTNLEPVKEESPKIIEPQNGKRRADQDIHMKYILALKEAQTWKSKYLTSTNEKVTQLSNIESSLMVLEARLQAERRDIERRFNKQTRTLKEQKRKIAKLTTANQKLLTGLMALSQKKSIANEPLIECVEEDADKPDTRADSRPFVRKNQAIHDHIDDRIVRYGSKHKIGVKTHRSKSLPLNRHNRHYKSSSTPC